LISHFNLNGIFFALFNYKDNHLVFPMVNDFFHKTEYFLYRKEMLMSIHFSNPIDNPRLYPLSRVPLGTDNIQKKGLGELGSFRDYLNKISDSQESLAIQPSQSQSALKNQKALEFCQRMEVQMNESLLQILSDTEEENNFETSLMYDDPMGILFKGTKEESVLSTIRQGPSKTDPPQVQIPEQIIEKQREMNRYSPDVHWLDDIIREAAITYGVDSELIRGVIQAESDFDPNAISPKGATGLMQLMPETAKELGVNDPFNPAENIMGGTKYLKKLLDHYNGSVPLALAAYNWGMGNMDSDQSRMPAETRNYVSKITGIDLYGGPQKTNNVLSSMGSRYKLPST